MSDNITITTLNNIEFKIIGTAHVSRESIDEVKSIICEDKPDIVCVELDQARYNSITQNDTWSKLDLAKVFKDGKAFLLIANLVLSSFQRRLGNQLGVKPGDEMKIAVETAKEYGLKYSLCDREVHTTLRRAWAKCGLWSKTKLLASLLASAFTTEKLDEKEIENLKNKNELDGMMSELSNYLPAVKEVLIDERDRYLAAKIWESAKSAPCCETTNAPCCETPTAPCCETTAASCCETSSAPCRDTAIDGEVSGARDAGIRPVKKIAAVIGAGHMLGIVSHLEKLSKGEESSDVSALDIIPPPSFLSKAAGFIIPAAIIALIAAGFIGKGTDIGLEIVLTWVLWNGSLAALGSLISLAHPLAIISSFVGAPFATLNPLIGIGMIAGLVQIAVRKPRVSDVQNITEDATNIKGIYRNRILKALLVFFLSSIGGVIGNFISFPAIGGLLLGK